MSLEDKRQLYACGTKFTTLEQVVTWPHHVSADKTKLISGMLFLVHISNSNIMHGGIAHMLV